MDETSFAVSIVQSMPEVNERYGDLSPVHGFIARISRNVDRPTYVRLCLDCVRLNIPLWLVKAVCYLGLVVWLGLLLVLSPVIFLYWLFICVRVRREWLPSGKDVLIVYGEAASSRERMKQLLPLLGARSELLNWSERKLWKRWSVASQVFRFYSFLGPEPFRLESSLPVMFIFKAFYWPQTFSFSPMHDDSEVIGRFKLELERAIPTRIKSTS